MDRTSLAGTAGTRIERARAADHGRSAHTLSAVEDTALLFTVSVVLGAHAAVAAAGPVYSWQEDRA